MIRAFYRLLPLLLGALVLLNACGAAKHPKVDPMRKQLESARERGAPFCHPREFAAAEAYLDFAAESYELGNRAQVDELLALAKENLAVASADEEMCQSDLDGDRVIDVHDDDPYRAEDFDGFEDEDGAPEDDNDGDGFLDGEDRCPQDPEDFDDFEDHDGCPDNDNDYDGVPDDKDLCPGEAEDIDGWEDDDGCPDSDNDNDKFPDSEDACPDHPETINGFLDDDGCPDQLPKKRKFIALPQVDFLGGTVYMTGASKASLGRFATKLMKNSELHVRIESHAAGRHGDEEALVVLTKQRAEKIKQVLVEFGVLETRLKALGFGSSRPIAGTDTYAGRRKNERINFIIYLP
ncbi:MAG: OmpA family protein [Candidatus Lernaella stagnicola]|nr:OmpA family protein [Candidatus Lernaella stagnicola]